MKNKYNKMFTRIKIIFLCFLCVKSLDKEVVHAISFGLSEAELSMHLIP